MSEKRLPNSNPQVKRKVGLPVAKKHRRKIPDGATFTTTTLNKMSKRTRAGKKSPGYLLKREFKEWLRDYPGMSAAMWNVACVLVDLYNFRYGKAWPSTETIKEMSGVKSIRTVKNAIKFFHDEGLIFVKSGGYGSVRSNNYVPNLRLILNSSNGEIIKNAPYRTKTENWAVVSGQTPRGCHVPGGKICTPNSGGKICTPKKGKKRHNGANPGGKKCTLRSDSVVERAQEAAPTATPDGSANGFATRAKKESHQRKIRYIQISTMALYVDMTFDGLIQLFDGKGSQADIEIVDDWCKAEIFNGGKSTSGTLEHKLPSDVAVFGHVVIHGDQRKVTFVETGNSTLLLKKKSDSRRRALGPDNWLAIDYRVSPEYQIEAEAKVKELKSGI